MELILIRHGETDANREGRLKNSGDFSPTLNSTGRAQAVALACALETDLPFDLYTSPIRRARETAQIISGTLGVPFSVVEGLAEIDVGALEGLAPREIRREYPTYIRDKERNVATARCPGGETIQELQNRAWDTVQCLADSLKCETVVAVSHHYTILTIVAKLLHIPLQEFRRIRLDVGALVRLKLGPNEARLLSSNETWHLRNAGILPDQS